MLLMQCCCWCTVAADALMLLMHWCCWCTVAADPLMLPIQWCCWCNVAADAMLLLMHCCCWCADAAELGPGIARRPFYSNLLQLKFLNVYWLKSLNICKQICFLMMTHWCACGPFSSNLPKFLAKSTIFPLKVHFGHSIRNSAHTPSVPCVTNIRFDWCLIALKEQI